MDQKTILTEPVELPDISKLNILHLTHPFLNRRPTDFDFKKEPQVDPRALAGQMFKRMTDLGGVGLSANQLGLDYRMFVMGVQEFRYYVFNPTIISTSKEEWLFEEACLSFPGFSLTLSRPREINVSYQNEYGEIVVQKLDGLQGRVFLHEYDHMEGTNFLMRASKFKLDYELRKWKKRLVKQQSKRGNK